MTRALAAIRRAMSALFPWPARSERKAAIARARDGREQAEARAAEAVGVEAQIRQLAAQNHFAAVIAEQLIQHHRREA